MYQAPEINNQFVFSNDKIQGFRIKLNGDKNIVLKKTE